MKTTLSIEQSARLIELGVDAKLASKCQVQHSADNEVEYRIVSHDEFCYEMASLNPQPIFDITDLLSILPKEIDGNILVINATGFNTDTEELEEGWCVFYVDSKYNVAYGEKSIFSAPELIDALYQLLIWCLEQGYCSAKKEVGNESV